LPLHKKTNRHRPKDSARVPEPPALLVALLVWYQPDFQVTGQFVLNA